jgi:hypothetical protein
MQTPVAFFVFRRPETTARVFDVIRRAQPRRLLIVADGPRSDDERARCEAARAIVEQVDWDCEVLRNYSDSNLGLRKRMSSGLDWVFEQCEEAIILEDDCLPDITFFAFCEQLLERFRSETRVMHISGSLGADNVPHHHSYYFSRFPHIWGWATWRRAWNHYDVDLVSWQQPHVRSAFLAGIQKRRERLFWQRTLNDTASGVIDTWDYQWAFACMRQGGLCVTPTRNLVANLGFGPDATHTFQNSAQALQQSMPMPITHPETMDVAHELDQETARREFYVHPTWKRLAWRVLNRFQALQP